MTNNEYEEMYKYETFMYLCNKYNLSIHFNEYDNNCIYVTKRNDNYESFLIVEGLMTFYAKFDTVDEMVNGLINSAIKLSDEDKNKFMEDYNFTVSRENIEGRNK